jgi:ParB family chromosome partitioning protein
VERRALGRGLSALIGAPEPEAHGEEVPPSQEAPGQLAQDRRSLATAEIEVNPYQPRRLFKEDKLQELADSIREHGILQPLVVRPLEGRYQLVSGERRLRASQLAGLAEVPVIVRNATDAEMLEMAIVENVQREDINPLEAAVAYRELMAHFGFTQEMVAKRVGKSRSTVANTLRLLGLPEPIQRSLFDGKITEGHARALLGIKDARVQEESWRTLLQTGGSVRVAELQARLAREDERQAKVARETPAAKTPAVDPNLQAVESDLRRHLGTKVTIDRKGHRGQIRIEFYNDEDLQRVLDLLKAG